MASSAKPLQIIPRGLNLLPPGDAAAEGDCLELSGWWPGSVGRLQQARGWVKKDLAEDAVTIDSLCEANGKIFFGGGGKLYMGTYDGAAEAAVDSGYDGYPLGLCAYQNMLWAMNRSKQRRVDPGTGTAYDWKVKDPPNAPTAFVSGGGGLADGDHQYYVSWVDIFGYETSPSPVVVANTPPGSFSTGTVAVTLLSANVVLTGATWDASIDGQQFRALPDIAIIYKITYVDPTHATISPAFYGATNATASYTITSPANTAKVKITRPTLAPADDASIASWNVYHRSPGLNAPYLVNTTPIAKATTTYLDYGDVDHQQDDETLISNGVVMEADHGDPPAARVMASKPYNGRLIVANSSAHPNRIWWTNALEPSYFPGSDNPQGGNWVDVGDDNQDAILNLSVRNGFVLIYRQKSIWRQVGDFGDVNAMLAPLIPNMGIVGPRAVVGTSQGDLAVVQQGKAFGIYRVTDWEQRISGKVEPIFNGLGSECYAALNFAAADKCALGYQLGRLWFSYPDGSNTSPNRTLICDVEQDSFSIAIAGRWFSRTGGFTAFLHASSYFIGASGQKVLSLEDGTGSEDGEHVALAYQSRYEDCGNPDHEKSWSDLVLSHNTGGAALTIKIKADKGADSFTLATITSSSLTRSVIPLVYPVSYPTVGRRGLPIEAFNLAIRIEGNGPTAYPGAYIDGPILLHYFLKPRKALTWDSGPTDHNVTGPKVVDMVEIDFDGPACKLFVQSDLMGTTLQECSPGGTGYAVSATTGRQVLRVAIGAYPNPQNSFTGRLMRYQLKSADGATPFLLYRIRVRALPIGMLLDGSFGDTWYTEPIAAGA